jgi:hypothetical protein
MAVIPPDLFKDTRFAENIRGAISRDITALVQFFPGLRAFRYVGAKGVKILLQGSVSITMNGADFAMPLNMSLPDSFPDAPPSVQIPTPPGYAIIPSAYLRADGYVFTEKFHKWVPRESRLPTFVHAITQQFSMSPPFKLAEVRIDMGEIEALGSAEAASLIDNSNSLQVNAANKSAEAAVAQHFLEIASGVKRELEASVGQLRLKIESAEGSPVDEVHVDSKFDQAMKQQAKDLAFEAAKNLLKDAYHDQKISVDDMLKATRELANLHFTQDLAPRITA